MKESDFILLLDALLESEIKRIQMYNYLYYWNKKTGWDSIYNFA